MKPGQRVTVRELPFTIKNVVEDAQAPFVTGYYLTNKMTKDGKPIYCYVSIPKEVLDEEG